MQLIKCYQIYVWDGCDRSIPTYYVKNKEDVSKWLSMNEHDSYQEKQIVIFDTFEELMDSKNGELRKKALAKLTEEEKFALGVK